MILELSSQPMEPPSWSIQISWLPGIVEGEELQAQLASVLRLNSSFRSRAEELLHAPMPEALDRSV
jgi:hypothetical protein